MRVDDLKQALGDKVDIRWRSFLLRPENKPGRDIEKFTEYTRSWERPAAVEPRAPFTTPWSSGISPPAGSMPAQVAWKVAAEFGEARQEQFHQRLLVAYFVENLDISDSQQLLDLAGEVGIDAAEFAQLLADRSEQAAFEVAEEHNGAIQRGITAVPTVVFNGQFAVPGAQDSETYIRVAERMIERIAVD